MFFFYGGGGVDDANIYIQSSEWPKYMYKTI